MLKTIRIAIGIIAAGLLANVAMAEPNQIITSCNTIISSPGEYTLGGDLICIDGNPSTQGIRIAADNVTLDCNGYGVKSDTFNGTIGVKGANAIIRNCVIEGVNPPGWRSQAILVYETENVLIEGNTIIGEYEGISLRNTRNSIVKNNIINSYEGILQYSMGHFFAWDGTGNIIRNNDISAEWGINLFGGYGRTFPAGDPLGSGPEPTVHDNLIEKNNITASLVSVALYGYCENCERDNNIKNNNLYGSPYTVYDWATVDDNIWDGNFWNPNGEYYLNSSSGIGAYSGDSNAAETPIVCGPDSDDDGIPNINDKCPKSILDANIVINGNDSGVKNQIFYSGCSMSDSIKLCADGAKNHGKFVSCVSKLLDDWKKGGWISGKEKGAIQSTAAKSNIP